ncbi:MAG TPA: class I SAM-dependent methyltransferase, partial [Woeseiaceae bacterium]|nr:class I SAM-dependent methyltransferase [Woeseiaceae bacterium]
MSVGSYVIRGGTAGRERLRLLSRILRPQTLDLFRKAGLAEGVNCLDIGCGGGDASFEMARIVGPSGLVLGIDLDDEKLALARAEAAELGLSNVEFRHADAMDPSAGRERFGFVFARQLLCHVADPAGVIRQMLDHAAPGGILAIEDIDFRGHFCWPPCP